MRDTSLWFNFILDLIRLSCRSFWFCVASSLPPASIDTVRLRNTCLPALRVTAIAYFSKGGDSSKVSMDVDLRKSLSSAFFEQLSRSCRMALTDFNVSVLG
jgi:hypothetical protein